MSLQETRELWSTIVTSRNLEQLRGAIEANRFAAAAGLADLTELVKGLGSLQSSKALDQLRLLGTELAAAAGDRSIRARLTVERLQNAALASMEQGDRTAAAEMLSSSAAEALADDNFEELVKVNHYSILFLFRLGNWDAGLGAAEAMLDKADESVLANPRARMGLYEFSQVTKYAPAGDRWTIFLSRLSSKILRAGDAGLAAAIDCRLAETLVRCGAHEDALELLADLEDPLSRIMVKMADGRESRVPEHTVAQGERARALMLLGRDAEAELAYRGSLEKPELRSEAKTRLADLLFQTDRLQEALDLVQSSENLDSRLAAHASSVAAMSYSRMNRQEASLAAADQALSLLKTPQDSVGAVTQFQRQVNAGLEKLERVFIPLELEYRTELNLIESGFLRRDPPEQHAATLERILDWARGFGERSTEARCLRIQGDIAMTSGQSEAAIKKLEASIECEMVPAVSREWKNVRDNQRNSQSLSNLQEQWRKARLEGGVGMNTQLSLGRTKIECGVDPLAPLDFAIAASRRRLRRLVLYYALAAKGRYLRLRGEQDAARVVWSDAADVLESIRANVDGIESQVGVLRDKELAYAELLEIAVDSEDAISAMRIMERAKSRALLEEISVKRDAAPLDSQREQQARELRQNLIRYFNRDLTQDRDAEIRLLELKRSFAKLYSEPAIEHLKSRAAARPEEVAAFASKGTVVLEYFVAEDHILLAIARDGMLRSPLRLDCSRTELEELMDSLSFEISTRERCYSLNDLYAILIEPAAELLEGSQRLVIVPHGDLHRLPFHALQRKDGTHLGQIFSLVYAPSIAIARLASKRWGQREGDVAVLMAGNETPYSALPSLRNAEVEINEIAKHLAGSTLLKGRNASRRQLIHLEGDIDVLHLSCHGEFDRDDALLSRVYLADGPIYGYEIERLQCRPRLAVLSACETALQRRTAGDETFGLVRAFLTKGAETVVASLWKVADESTTLLMGKLYEELQRNSFDVPGALRSAQTHLLSTAEYAHPFFWAPYIAIGGSGVRDTALQGRNI